MIEIATVASLLRNDQRGEGFIVLRCVGAMIGTRGPGRFVVLLVLWFGIPVFGFGWR